MAWTRHRGGSVSGCRERWGSRPVSERGPGIRHAALAAALPRVCGAIAGVAAASGRRVVRLLALAAPASLSRLRRFSRSIAVVCGAETVRQHGRLHLPHVLLLLPFTASGERGLAYRTGDRG